MVNTLRIPTQYNQGNRIFILPWWLKFFMVIFIIMSIFIPIAMITGFIGPRTSVTLYGIETREPFSKIAWVLLALFWLKGIVSYGLFAQKNWAVLLGLFDAILGVSICFYSMFIAPFLFHTSSIVFRYEVLFLLPYFHFLHRIRNKKNLGNN